MLNFILKLSKRYKIYRLKLTLKKLKPIVFKGFNTTEELKLYKQKNSKAFNLYHDIFDEIETLKWELMTAQEKEKATKRDRFLELKAKGEPFDLSDFEGLNDK